MSNEKKDWLREYLELYKSSIFNVSVYDNLVKVQTLWQDVQNRSNKVIFLGNGGSAAMASYCAVDLTKNADIRAINFNEADLISCFANDYGFENWISKAIEFYADNCDLVVLISSSGASINIINAAKKCKE